MVISIEINLESENNFKIIGIDWTRRRRDVGEKKQPKEVYKGEGPREKGRWTF